MTGGEGPQDDAAPLRTRVRHEVLPVLEAVLGAGAVEALARSAGMLRADAEALDAAASELLARATVEDPDPPPAPGRGLVLDVVTLAAAPDALRHRALRAAALAVGAPAGATGSRHVAALDALVVAWRGQGAVGLPSGASARRVCGRLFLIPGPAGAPLQHTLP